LLVWQELILAKNSLKSIRRSLSKADTSGVESIRQITGLESIARKDEDKNLIDQSIGQELVGQAPKSKDGYIEVPEIMKGK
jgi:Asp-tRNA(Asn)/Glu-tRNA(Gln) amidotransferase C subunit